MTETGLRRSMRSPRAVIGALARRGLAGLHSLSGAAVRDRARLDGSCAAVLMYHRVLPQTEALRLRVEPGMYVTPETFERHLDWLQRDFSVVALHEITERLRAGERLPARACAITLDDGWRDNLDHALPALETRKLPATIFAVADRVGTIGAFWPDDVVRRLAHLGASERAAVVRRAGLDVGERSIDAVLSALKALREADRTSVLDSLRAVTRNPLGEERELLGWDELDRLAERGISIESHGRSHAILTGLSRAQAADELKGSLATLVARGHARHRILAYPSGAFDPDVVELAREAGYLAAFTTEVGLASGRSDALAQPRVAVHEDISRTRSEFLRWVPGTAKPLTARSTGSA